jgi:hypothetical protein
MNETQATLDRLERRLEEQTARIDALYRMLERRGLVPRAVEAGRGERPAKRRPTRLRLGSATGV